MTFGPPDSINSFLPPEINFPEEDANFKDILSRRERLTSSIINAKENSQYEKTPILTAQTFFSQPISGAIKSFYTYRLTFDLVQMNGGPIGVGVTTITLQTNPAVMVPTKINIPTAVIPVHGFGAATNATNFIFINDPTLFVRTNIWSNATQQIIITNNTGSSLTQCYWIFEYILT